MSWPSGAPSPSQAIGTQRARNGTCVALTPRMKNVLVIVVVIAAGCTASLQPDADAPAPRCDDGLHNGGESDRDCGGYECMPCTNGQTCGTASDCESGNCAASECEGESCPGRCEPPPCGGPNESCCAGSKCDSGLACNLESNICNYIDLRSGVNCNNDCKTPNELCISRGFTGAVTMYAYFMGQCAGTSECPAGWSGLTCSDWCGGVNCVGTPYCGGPYQVFNDNPSPTTKICTSDHGGNCIGDNPGYYIRGLCY